MLDVRMVLVLALQLLTGLAPYACMARRLLVDGTTMPSRRGGSVHVRWGAAAVACTAPDVQLYRGYAFGAADAERGSSATLLCIAPNASATGRGRKKLIR